MVEEWERESGNRCSWGNNQGYILKSFIKQDKIFVFYFKDNRRSFYDLFCFLERLYWLIVKIRLEGLGDIEKFGRILGKG